MAVRVVWGLSATMDTFWPTSAFNKVDLPALGRPRMETKPETNFLGVMFCSYEPVRHAFHRLPALPREGRPARRFHPEGGRGPAIRSRGHRWWSTRCLRQA